MEITTQSSIDISESLASFLLGSHVSNNMEERAIFEKRLDNVNTGRYSIADVYIPGLNTAIEVKSIAHGSSALKGVLQSSMYKEQVQNSVFCMQKPRRKGLVDGIESFADHSGVGVIWLVGIPTICSEDIVKKVTGGISKPFQLWKERRYTTTKDAIQLRSRTNLINEYIETLEQIIQERTDEVFEFAVDPDSNVKGFSGLYD